MDTREWEKELSKFANTEGCQAGSPVCGEKKDGVFVCQYCKRWNGPEGMPKSIQVKYEVMRDFIRELLETRTKYCTDIIKDMSCIDNKSTAEDILKHFGIK